MLSAAQTRTKPNNPLSPSEATVEAPGGRLPEGDQTRLRSSRENALQSQDELDPETGKAHGQQGQELRPVPH